MTLTLSPEKTGTWALHEVLTSAQVNKIASELVKAVDGVGGGTYTLSIADLQFTGSATFILALAMQLTAGHNFAVDGHINLSATGQVNVASSGRINLASGAAISAAAGAAIALAAGASLTLATTSTIASTLGAQLTGSLNLAGEIVVVSGGLVTLQAGGIQNVQSGGAVQFARSQDLKIASETCFWRGLMVPQWVSLRAGNTLAWDDNDETGAGGGAWYLNDTSALRIIRFALARIPGDILTSISMSLNGGAGAGHGGTRPASMPRIKIVQISSIGVRTVLADAVDASASAGAYDVSHVVALDNTTDTLSAMPLTVPTDPLYVEVHGEHGANAVDSTLKLNSYFGQSTSKLFRSNFEFA